MNTMAEALKKAGVQTMRQLLEREATDAVRAHPKDFEKAVAAFVDRVAPDDLMLTWLVDKGHVIGKAKAMISYVARDLARNDGGEGAGARVPDGQVLCAPPAVAETPERAAGGGQIGVVREDRSSIASAGSRSIHVSDDLDITETRASAGGEGRVVFVAPMRDALPAKPNPPAVGARGITAVAAVMRKSLLDTFVINGIPLGNVTAGEARGWAASRRRDARFIDLLTENLPSYAVIRDYRGDADEVQRIYEIANLERASE